MTWRDRERARIFGATLAALSLSMPLASLDGSEGSPETPSLAAPTAQHRLLAYFLGSWETTTRLFSAAGEELEIAAGRSTFRFVLGRHYLMETFEGSLRGESYEEVGFVGFDPHRQQFVATWMNDFELRPNQAFGSFEAASRTLVMHGFRDDVASGSSEIVAYVLRLLAEDEFLFQVLDPVPDPDRLRIEIRYRRLASGAGASTEDVKPDPP